MFPAIKLIDENDNGYRITAQMISCKMHYSYNDWMVVIEFSNGVCRSYCFYNEIDALKLYDDLTACFIFSNKMHIININDY